MRLRNKAILNANNDAYTSIDLLYSLTKFFSFTSFIKVRSNSLFIFFIAIVFSMLSYHVGMGQQVIGSFTTMDGGFEAQSGSLTNTSIATNTVSSSWTSANTGTSVNATGGRSGPKYITFNKSFSSGTLGSGSHIRIQSPTSALSAITASTAYTVQFFYRISGASITSGSIRAAVSNDGTTVPNYSAAIANVSNTNWAKAQFSSTPVGGTTTYGVGIIDPYWTAYGNLIYDFDDFVVYAGAPDNTAPNDPTAATVTSPTINSLNVSWTAPSGGVDGGGYVVVRYATSPNADNDPNQNGIYATGNTITNGTGSLTGTIVYIGTGTSFTDNSLAASTTYYYKVYAVDKAFNYSNEANVNATTSSPGIVSSQSGNWSSASTWVGGVVPTSSQNVIIASSHTVTVDVATIRNAGTTTTVTGTLATGVTYTDNGTPTINGSFQINQGGWATGTNFVYGSSGTLIFNNSSGLYGVNSGDAFWPTSNGPVNVTVQGTGGMQLNAARSVSGLFQTAAQVVLNGVALTINGSAQLNANGYFSNVPTYGSNGTLIYNTTYGVFNEWTGNSTTPGVGIPKNVTIQNSAVVTMPTSTRGIGGNMTINSGSLILSTTSGSDLYIGGNWTRASGTSFTPNSRAVFFNGNVIQNISGSSTFSYLFINNSAGINLQTSTDLTIDNNLTLTNGKIVTGSTNKVIIGQSATVSRTNGWVYGNLQKYFSAGTAVQQLFEVGGSSNYLPDTVWANVDQAGSLLLSCTDLDHPNLSTSQLNTAKSINRYWNLSAAGAVISSYDASFNYLLSDIDAGSSTVLFQSSYYNAPDWVLYSVITVYPANYFKLSNATLFGNIAVGESKSFSYYRSLKSGSWTSDTTWQVSNDNLNWVNAPSGFYPDAITATVTIQSPHTVSKTDKSPRSVKNLIVASGASLIASSTVGQLTYLTLYGNIVCNGNIGTGVLDSLSFNVDGVNDTISGTGTFKCQRIRKNFTTNFTTNLVIGINLTTGFGSSSTTSVYNNAGTSYFNIVVNPGATLNASSLSIDGVRGLGSGRNSGTYSIYGTLNVSDTLYASTDNGTASYSCNIIIFNGGIVNTKLIKSPASGAGKHSITIQNGGRLNITGAAGFYLFSTTNNIFDFQPGSTVDYSANASQAIESGIPYYDNLNLSGSGNKTANGDLNIRGNWTRSSSVAFVPNLKAVFFNGTVSNQKITVTGGGTESFAYLIINKPAAQSLQLSASPATNIAINGGNGGNAFQLQNGNFDLNGRTCTFAVFNGNVNNIGIDGSAGNLTRNITSTIPGGVFSVFNADLTTGRFTTIQRLSANAALLNFASGDTLFIGGTSQNSGINFGVNLTTITGNFQINTWGYVESNSPSYAANSNLIYNSGGSYKRFKEWADSTGAGYPFNVIIQNNTSLRINDDNLPVNNNGNGTANRAMAGSFTISSGSSAIMGDSTENNKLTIGKDFILNGSITLPSTTAAIGADLYIGGNWNRSSTGVFNHNDRAVFFNGTTNSTITASGGQYFPYLYLQKTSSTNTLSLLDDITIGKIFTVIAGTFDPAAKDATLRSRDTTAQFGPVGTNGSVTYSGSGRFVVERFASARRAWRLLSSPTRHDFQTIKQSWQENAVTPNSNPVPGYGIQITSNRTSWQTDGFDTFSIAGPSLKCYNPSTNLYDGITTTNSNFVIGKAYMTFIRGNRSVTQLTQSPTTSILREKGRLIIGDTTFSIGTADSQFVSVGNPYASSIDFIKLTRNNLQPSYYLWDPILSTYGAFQTCLISGNSIIAVPGAGSYTSGNYNIQSGQGFFVRNTTGVGSLTFKELAKSEGSIQFNRAPDNFGSFRTNLYKIQSGNPVLYDGVMNIFDSSYSYGFDMMDAIKLNNTNENLSVKKLDKYFAIESRPEISETDTIQYSMGQMRATSYRFEFIPQRLASNNVEAFLEDSYLNNRLPISLTDTTFVDFNISNDVGSYYPERFRIVFNTLQPLPVSMTTLLAKRINDKDVLLSWNSENESGIRNYQVESSTDGRQFHSIGQELALLNNGGSAMYNYRHVNAPSSVVYYRVAAINMDGSIQYTNIVKVNALKENSSITVNPNPVSGNTISIDLFNMEQGSYSAILYTMEGKKIAKTSFSITGTSENKKMKIEHEIPSGKYNLVILSPSQLRYSIPVQIIK